MHLTSGTGVVELTIPIIIAEKLRNLNFGSKSNK